MTPRVTCCGELLWDVAGERRTLGGAPANVAYHLQRLGIPARLVTRIGRDALGDEALGRLRALGMDLRGVQSDASLPTGRADLLLDAGGQAHYAFATPAAWDAIEYRADDVPDVLVFGTLGQRDARSAAAIRALAAGAARRVLDVNLRPPFADAGLLEASMRMATLVKLNDDEVGVLADWFALPPHAPDFAAAVARRYGTAVVCITRGAHGAALWADGAWLEEPAVPTQVLDTVGAGDAFLAALVAGWLAGRPWSRTLSAANRLGSLVASRPGATPEYSPAADLAADLGADA